MNYTKILKEMSAYMGSETIFFDEDSWSYDSVKLTIDGEEVVVRSAWILEHFMTSQPTALMVEVEDKNGELRTRGLTPKFLKTLNEEEVYWLIHDIWWDIPWDWDDDSNECEETFCKLMKKAGISKEAKYFFGYEN
jgi:hypothetical protein